MKAAQRRRERRTAMRWMPKLATVFRQAADLIDAGQPAAAPMLRELADELLRVFNGKDERIADKCETFGGGTWNRATQSYEPRRDA